MKTWEIDTNTEKRVRWKNANGHILVEIEKYKPYSFTNQKEDEWTVKIGYRDWTAYTFFTVNIVSTKKEAYDLAKNLMKKYKHLRTKEELEELFGGL